VVALFGLERYSPEQLAATRAASPAFARYERLLADPAIDELHARRHRAWLECVAATYFATASTEAICAHWSATADALLRQAWRDSGLEGCEALLIALGKHGAEELNLSSDIDVMIVADPAQASVVEKGLRRFRQSLHHNGEFGFCYRLDFDLRPGGTMGPLMTSPSQFQDYYWSQGETWERLALVRLRPIVGSPALEKPIADLARRFSFRKFLDFTLLDDLKALRSQVHQKGFERRENELHLKLEVGGIRDIELFVHSLLVLNGGKLPELQTRSTGAALTLLQARGLLSAKEAQFLNETYWYFRHVENLVQSIDDRQTHVLSVGLSAPGLPPRIEVEERMRQVNQIVSGLLGQVDLEKIHLPAGHEAQVQWLQQLGFAEETITAVWDQLMKATALSHKNDRDERARQEFLFSFVTELARHKGLDRDLGLSLLLDFVRATRGKATFFSMLLRLPRLIQDLSRLFCISPYLASILVARPELLDHFILRVDEAWASEAQALLQQMSERKLLTDLWAANQFLVDGQLEDLFERISSSADEITAQLLRSLKIEFPKAKLEIVALGKWGGHELGLRSDLDFIFVSPETPNEDDFKVARRFISRLMYDVDLRLRPSGQSGPLLVSIDRLHEYWRQDAQAWERQAYLRARSLSSIALNRTDLFSRALEPSDLAELKRIRSKLLKPLQREGLDVKHAPGGLIDIEFAAQTALLARAKSVATTATLDMLKELAWPDRLGEIYLELRRFEQMLRLASSHKIKQVAVESPIFHKASALMQLAPEATWKKIEDLLNEAQALLKPLDPVSHVHIGIE
jgi:glutamate-ammonia-ligase adenylyltransferase